MPPDPTPSPTKDQGPRTKDLAQATSILIPSFNSALYLAAAIDSALAQTNLPSPPQILVVDDGSTDNSPDIARSYGDHITFLSQPNSGPAAARNLGLQHATGEFIQFLDADDLLHPTKLLAQLDALYTTGADVAICQNLDLLPGGGTCPGAFHYATSDIGHDPFLWLAATYIHTGVPLIRRTALTHVGGFRPALHRGEEKDLWLRLAASGATFTLVDQALYTIRHHDAPDRTANSDLAIFHHRARPTPAALAHRLDAMISLFELLSTGLIYDFNPARRQAIASHIRQTSIYNWRDGDPTSARRGFDFLRRHRLDPPYGERPLYKLAARLLGHPPTETILSLARSLRRTH